MRAFFFGIEASASSEEEEEEAAVVAQGTKSRSVVVVGVRGRGRGRRSDVVSVVVAGIIIGAPAEAALRTGAGAALLRLLQAPWTRIVDPSMKGVLGDTQSLRWNGKREREKKKPDENDRDGKEGDRIEK